MPTSDIDIIVDFNQPVGIEFIDLAEYIELQLQKKVDLVSRKGVKDKYFKAIEQEIVYVLAEPKLLVGDLLESAHKILDYTAGQSFEDFKSDSKTVDAVIRNFEIIGEAANRLREEFKESFSKIDWHRIRGFRNRIVHDYFGIDYSIVWTIKETFLPLMIAQLKPLSET